MDEEGEVTFIKWNYQTLCKLLDETSAISSPEEKQHCHAFRNAIHSLWMQSVTDYIVNIDN